jgi:hypothetical protein
MVYRYHCSYFDMPFLLEYENLNMELKTFYLLNKGNDVSDKLISMLIFVLLSKSIKNTEIVCLKTILKQQIGYYSN